MNSLLILIDQRKIQDTYIIDKQEIEMHELIMRVHI